MEPTNGTTALAKATPAAEASAGLVRRGGVELDGFDDMWRFSKAMAASGMSPKGLEKPEAVFIALQLGCELGLQPMQAIQSIAVIGGRPTVWGDAVFALVRGSGLLERHIAAIAGDGDQRTATFTVKRKGEAEIVSTFSVADAKRAGLWGKAGPWSQYPDRMLAARARTFALRDAFGDVLKGLRTSEEAMDMRDEVTVPATSVLVPPSAPAVQTEAEELVQQFMDELDADALTLEMVAEIAGRVAKVKRKLPKGGLERIASYAEERSEEIRAAAAPAVETQAADTAEVL